jgi:hypothetical protein
MSATCVFVESNASRFVNSNGDNDIDYSDGESQSVYNDMAQSMKVFTIMSAILIGCIGRVAKA